MANVQQKWMNDPKVGDKHISQAKGDTESSLNSVEKL